MRVCDTDRACGGALVHDGGGDGAELNIAAAVGDSKGSGGMIVREIYKH